MESSLAENSPAPDPVFTLVFNQLPKFDIGLIAEGIRACEPLKQDVTYQLDAESDAGFSAQVMFDDHQVHLVGLNAPLPPGVIDQSVKCSKFHPKLTQEMLAPRAHIICYYTGGSADPVEQLMALEKVALAYLPMGVLGLLDSGAWNCRPRVLMEKFDVKHLRACLQGEPHMVSLGFVKFIKDDGVWFCSKGQHRFGLPDFAWLATLNEAQAVYDAFGKLFLQLRADGGRPQPGDTAVIGGNIYVRFREVYEYGDWLNGPAGTLVIERTNEAEARTGGPTGAGTLHESGDQVVMVKGGDEAMELAFALARESLPHFWQIHAHPQNGESGFGLKVKVADRYGTEHFWMGDIERKDGQIYGRVNNEPKIVKTIKEGQRLVLPPDDIVDWLYMRHGKMVGNYTARVLVRTLPPAEAQKYQTMMCDFVPLKVNCPCGQHYSFEIEAVNGKMPGPVQCPACGADGTAGANATLAAIFKGEVAGTVAPKPQGKLSLTAATKPAAPPAEPPRAARVPPKTEGGAIKVLKGAALAIGGLILVIVLGLALLVHFFSPRHYRPAPFPTPHYTPPSHPPGNGSATATTSTFVGRPVIFHDRHATFTDLQGNEYNDVVLTIAVPNGLSYFKPGARAGVLPYTNLPTEFLAGLGVPTNWPGVLK